jgi:hypothetical protein
MRAKFHPALKTLRAFILSLHGSVGIFSKPGGLVLLANNCKTNMGSKIQTSERSPTSQNVHIKINGFQETGNELFLLVTNWTV